MILKQTFINFIILLFGIQISFAEPKQASLHCTEGNEKYPFVTQWVQKLDNFIAPLEVGTNDGSLFYGIGATTTSSDGLSLWKQDQIRLPLQSQKQNKSGFLELGYLGGPPQNRPPVFASPQTDLTNALKRQALKVSGSVGMGWERFWELLFADVELKLLGECTKNNCKIKFNSKELAKITGASDQYKMAQYRSVVQKRIEDFEKTGSVYTYEGESNPLDWLDLPIQGSFPEFLNKHFWLPQVRNEYGYELLDSSPGVHKPVTGLFSRVCEKRTVPPKGAPLTVCQDVVLYNNHYFDFWGRILVFIPWCGGVQVVLAYEVVDVDQIKSSKLARILFGSEMRNQVGSILETRLKRLHMLGSSKSP